MKSSRMTADTADDESLARDLDATTILSEASKGGSKSQLKPELELSYLDFDSSYLAPSEDSSWKDPNLDEPLETPESRSFHDNLFLPCYTDLGDDSDIENSINFAGNDWDENTLDLDISDDDYLDSTLFSEDSDPDDGRWEGIAHSEYSDDQEFSFDMDGTPELVVNDLEFGRLFRDLDSNSRQDNSEISFPPVSPPELEHEQLSLDHADSDSYDMECARGYFDDLPSKLSNGFGVAESGAEVFLGHEDIDERSEWSRERCPEVANNGGMDWDAFTICDEEGRDEVLLHVDSVSNSEPEDLYVEEF